MSLRISFAVLCIVWAASLTAVARQSVPGQPSQTAGAQATPARQLVTTYCVSCHNQKMRTANLALDGRGAVGNSAETWEKVVVQLRSQSMPPPRSRRPDAATYESVATWLESELNRAGAAAPNPGRPPALHRLNRTEYANAIRDLFGIEIDGTAMLPPDEQAHGFDNIADALTVTPALQVRFDAAAKIARMAVGDPKMPAGFERYTAAKNNSNERTQLWHRERFGDEFLARAVDLPPGTISRRWRACLQNPDRENDRRRHPRPARAEWSMFAWTAREWRSSESEVMRAIG
jgi:mono/diheme cytochrome c family protein